MKQRRARSEIAPLVGYADRFSVRPGETLSVMVSTPLAQYRAEVVHLISAETSRDGRGFRERRVPRIPVTTHPGRLQPLHLGSYATVPDHPALDPAGSFTIGAWIYPTTPRLGRQSVLARAHPDGNANGYELAIDPDRGLVLTVNGESVATDVPLDAARWYFIAAVIDVDACQVTLVQRPTPDWPVDPSAVTARRGIRRPVRDAPPHATGHRPPGRFTLAASPALAEGPERVASHFNGRIDRPRIVGAALSDAQLDALYRGASPGDLAVPLIAAWDFSLDIPTDRIVDTGPLGLHGTTRNTPARAMTDHTWDGSSLDWTADPASYGAIHFHDDDLDDAGWDVDREIRIPPSLRSGFYAVKLTGEDEEGYVPFFVCPPAGRATSDLLFLASTNTYLAYANLRPWIAEDASRVLGIPYPYPLGPEIAYAVEHDLLSLYSRHSDDSGVCYSSRLRPILNLHPKVNDEPSPDGRGYAHCLKADLHVAGWLAAKGIAFDVATDEDLHRDGAALLARYRVLMTGTHPEYWTGAMLDALSHYERTGGRVIYLGGNGFYWVTSYDPARPHVIEVRRWAGTRAWTARVGEYRHSTTGELGGLWRERGRPPQALVGVGFTAQGDGPARPYHRTDASHDPRAAWIFEGVGDDEPIGDSGLVMDGAAGFEVDRVDPALGTPPHTLVVATATGFGDAYQHVVEEVRSANSLQGGPAEPRVRADMVFYETPSGGAVFSVGSISFGGSLPMNGYRNAAAQIAENVVRRFMEDRPPGG